VDKLFERAVKAVRQSLKLVRSGKREKALDLLDDRLAEAIRQNHSDLIVMLGHHAEILAQAGGDLARANGHARQCLGHVSVIHFSYTTTLACWFG